jgi:ribosomal protection tetracycline resistance protein
MSSPKKVITIGILAHVDAGKTSITEALLHHSGSTTALGSVDKGSAITDGLTMEKSRGISIKSAAVHFTWKQRLFQLVDTPGHIDFSAEVDTGSFCKGRCASTYAKPVGKLDRTQTTGSYFF